MKQFILLLAIVSTVFLANAQVNKTPYMTQSLSGKTIQNVQMETSGGSLSVTAVPSSEMRLEVYVSGNNGKDLSNDEIKQRLEEMYELTVNVSGNSIIAKAKPKDKIRDWKKALSISFKAFVPKNVSSDLSTSGGSINLEGISGSQDFSTSGGSLNIKSVSGKIRGRTSGGSINVSNSSDDIQLTTSGGSINADNCSGKLRLTTSGGSVVLSNLKGDIEGTTSGGSVKGNNISGELKAHTSGGSVKLQDMNCSLEASTSGGHIDVEIASLGKYIKIRNSGGNIDLQLPKGKGLDLDIAANSIKTEQLTNFSGKADSDQIEGKVNGGGVPVDVSSGSGRIYLAFK